MTTGQSLDNDGVPFTQTELSIVLIRVEDAIRRLDRADATFRVDWTYLTTGAPGPLPPDAIRAMFDFRDAIDHALVSAHRAAQGRRYLDRRGLSLTAITQAELVRSLRDLQEHWEEWLPGRSPGELDEKPWLKTKSAGKRLEALNPPKYWEGTSSGSSDSGLRTWQGIDVPRLRTELQQLYDELAVLAEAAPKHPSLIALE